MQPYYDKLLLIAGEEMTTVRGHSNVWGTMGFSTIARRIMDSPSMKCSIRHTLKEPWSASITTTGPGMDTVRAAGGDGSRLPTFQSGRG